MRTVLFFGICLSICAAGVRAEEKGKGELKLDEATTLPAPAEGYAWKKVKESKEGEPKVAYYLAAKDGSTDRIVLILEGAAVDTDGKKIARIKADYNSIVKTMQDQGFTDMKSSKPPLDTPVKSRVVFEIIAKDKEGKPFAFREVLVFGKTEAYHFQIMVADEETAKTFAKVADAIKE